MSGAPVRLGESSRCAARGSSQKYGYFRETASSSSSSSAGEGGGVGVEGGWAGAHVIEGGRGSRTMARPKCHQRLESSCWARRLGYPTSRPVSIELQDVSSSRMA